MTIVLGLDSTDARLWFPMNVTRGIIEPLFFIIYFIEPLLFLFLHSNYK